MKLVNGTTVYMIRDSRGMLSRGGTSPRFGVEGKMWRTLGQVKSHLALFRSYQGVNEVPDDWEVIEVKLVQFGNAQNARQLVQPYADKQAKRQAQYKNSYEKGRADAEKRELKRLKEKYESERPSEQQLRVGAMKLIFPGMK